VRSDTHDIPTCMPQSPNDIKHRAHCSCKACCVFPPQNHIPHCSQILLTFHSWREPDTRGTRNLTLAPLSLPAFPHLRDLVNSSLLQTESWTYPNSAAASHTLPRIAADLSTALGVRTFESAAQNSLFESWAHPGKRVEEVMCTRRLHWRW